MEETSQDIGFTRNNQWFRYRAAGIIIKDDAVLMVGNDHNDYYYSVGLQLEIERLAFIHENFFTGQESDFLNKVNCHELSFYFLMKPLTENLSVKSESFGTDGSKEFLKWIPIAEYKNYKAFPTFFADELKNLSVNSQIKRIVTTE